MTAACSPLQGRLMATKMENREVEVRCCDFCGDESRHLDKCALCKREMCNRDGSKAHTQYSLEIYRYVDGNRAHNAKICHDCAHHNPNLSVLRLLDIMMGDQPLDPPAEGVTSAATIPNGTF